MKINDLRHVNYDKRLHELNHGESFMFEQKLYRVIKKYSQHHKDKYLIHDVYNQIIELPISTTVTPVHIEINIIKNTKE